MCIGRRLPPVAEGRAAYLNRVHSSSIQAERRDAGFRPIRGGRSPPNNLEERRFPQKWGQQNAGNATTTERVICIANTNFVLPYGYEYMVNSGTGETDATRIVNTSTGEIVDAVITILPYGTISYTPEQVAAYQKRKEKERIQREKEQEQAFLRRNGPKFVFGASDTEYEDIRPATAARLFYLATYLKNGSQLWTTERKRMKREDLFSVMCLSRAETYKFWSEVSPFYVFEDGKGELVMNGEFFRRGKLPPGRLCHRLYIESIQDLYRLAHPRQHKNLGYVFQMLPFVSTEFDMLCHNPDETDLEQVNPLSIDEFCEAIDYDPTQRNRLMMTYSKITFHIWNKEERFCSFVTSGGDISTAKIFVNPHILYRGHRANEVEILGKFCEI